VPGGAWRQRAGSQPRGCLRRHQRRPRGRHCELDRACKGTDAMLAAIVMARPIPMTGPIFIAKSVLVRPLAERHHRPHRSVHRADDERNGQAGSRVWHPACGQQRTQEHRGECAMQANDSQRPHDVPVRLSSRRPSLATSSARRKSASAHKDFMELAPKLGLRTTSFRPWPLSRPVCLFGIGFRSAGRGNSTRPRGGGGNSMSHK